MKKAWIENGVVRDICPADPALSYHPDVAAFYSTDVPDATVNGATLVEGAWVNPSPPTEAEIAAIAAAQAAAALAVTKANALANIRSKANEIILAKYPLWVQINYANGIYPVASADEMRTKIASVIAESNRCETIITAGGTPVPVWPVI